MGFQDRYATATRSANLKTEGSTTWGDTDVLGAAGLAGKVTRSDGRPGAPLAMALARLFVGDNHASAQIVDLLAAFAYGRAKSEGLKARYAEVADTARAVLAWHRDGICQPCHGHGYQLIDGAPALSGMYCTKCRGSGKMLFHKQFRGDLLTVAQWMVEEVEREQSKAGPAAMAMLAPRLDL